MEAFTRIVNPGSTEYGRVFLTISYQVKTKAYRSHENGAPFPEAAIGVLSISGVEGPMANGDCRGSCGQILKSLERLERLGSSWDQGMVYKLKDLWERWHLNDMRSGCIHQTAEGWAKRPIDPSKPLRAYGKHFEGQKSSSWNMLTWVSKSEHPEGLLSEPCPACGYRFGSAWLYEPVPEDVLEWLESLPSAESKCPENWR